MRDGRGWNAKSRRILVLAAAVAVDLRKRLKSRLGVHRRQAAVGMSEGNVW
jgi:hypothetical protein